MSQSEELYVKERLCLRIGQRYCATECKFESTTKCKNDEDEPDAEHEVGVAASRDDPLPPHDAGESAGEGVYG